MKLLSERTALGEIQNLLARNSTAKLAVAFWGFGVVEQLDLARTGLTAEILCNLESGACNPAVIRELRDLPNLRLRSHPALHAKIYWTPEAVVIGSSNASTNGLAIEGEDVGAWVEANVLSDDPELLGQVSDWFAAHFNNGHEISDADLQRAQRLWNARTKLKTSGKRAARSLLAAYSNAPRHPVWQKVKLAFWTDPLEPEDETWLEAHQKLGVIPPEITAYAKWNQQIRTNDWVIDVDLRGNAAEVSLWRAVPSLVKRADLRLVRPATQLSFDAFGPLTVSTEERASLASLAPVVLNQHGDAEKRNAVIDLPTAMALLPAPAEPPNEAAFHRAMQNLAITAAQINYHPWKFVDILSTLGGVETARLLISGNTMHSTYGFTKLWENQRLDLSVEALILKPKWRGLFTDAELAVARQRLVLHEYTPPD